MCNLLIDVEEWGQIVIINMLTRYSRTQFLDPNKAVSVAFRAQFLGAVKSQKVAKFNKNYAYQNRILILVFTHTLMCISTVYSVLSRVLYPYTDVY